jgi:hypothetical protein
MHYAGTTRRLMPSLDEDRQRCRAVCGAQRRSEVWTGIIVARRAWTVSTAGQAALSQAGFDGDLESRVLSLGRGRLARHAPSEEVPARAA